MFPTTRWTLVVASRQGTEERRAALEELLSIYWRPVYVYARRKGLDRPAAEDAVQGFFLRLLEQDFPDRLDPEKGRLRGYLKAAFDHFVVNLHLKDAAQKRGGGQRHLPLDAVLVERELAAAPEPPDAAFEREWAVTVMEHALARLRREYEDGRRKGDVETVLRFFRLDGAPPSYEEAAAACGMTPPQFKAALHRARSRFRAILREEVAGTVGDDDAADAELADLVRILRS